MPFKSTLELYSSIVLPVLAKGPMTLQELDMPAYALEHLEAHGLVVGRSYAVGCLGVKAWFLKEDWELLQAVGGPRRDCATMTFDDLAAP